MAVEYLLVVFRDSRQVLADGNPVGVTNHTLLIPPSEYEIALGGDGFSPTSQTVTITGTSIMRPKVITFS